MESRFRNMDALSELVDGAGRVRLMEHLVAVGAYRPQITNWVDLPGLTFESREWGQMMDMDVALPDLAVCL